jgi:general secretion pathway protein C
MIDIQDLIKRHFWAVGAITVATCAFFGGKAVGHYVEGKFLTDAARAPKIDPIAKGPAQPTTARSKSGKPLGDRNIFCSECLPPIPEPAVATPSDGSTVPRTAEPLQLIATSVHPKGGAWSMATILNTSTQAQGGYIEGAEIPGAGKIKSIQYKWVDFENAKNGNRLERISLLDEPAPAAAPAVATAPVDTTPKDEMGAAIDSGIKKIDDTNFEIDRALIDKLLANPLAVSKGARVTPSIKNGKPNGIKLYAIRPSSIYAKLGLANGDTIHSINGFELDSLDKGLEVYQKVKDASGLQVSATRRGKPVVINYTIK